MVNNPLDAVHDLLTQFVLPQEGFPIVYGWQNRYALPKSKGYVVLTLVSSVRRGTNCHEYIDNGTSDIDRKVSSLYLYDVQIDFCGEDQSEVQQLANVTAMLGNDSVGTTFTKSAFGLSCLYADAPRSLPFADEEKQWVVRYSVTLHLSGIVEWQRVQDAFMFADVGVKNVDVFFKG